MEGKDYVRELRREIGTRKIILNCAGALIERDGQVLLQRRADNGVWGFVGGILELDETYAEAAVREAKEETGLDVRLTAFLGLYHNHDMVWPSGDRAHTIGAYFTSQIIGGGEPRTDEESLELRFFPVDALPPLYFPDHIAAMRAYLDGVRLTLPEENRRVPGTTAQQSDKRGQFRF